MTDEMVSDMRGLESQKEKKQAIVDSSLIGKGFAGENEQYKGK